MKINPTLTYSIHSCFWCGKDTNSPFRACWDCQPKKEAAYKEAREMQAKGIELKYDDIMEMAYNKTHEKTN